MLSIILKHPLWAVQSQEALLVVVVIIIIIVIVIIIFFFCSITAITSWYFIVWVLRAASCLLKSPSLF